MIHQHVTGAIPIRRNTKDPAYLITLKAYVAELLRSHDLLFYPEGGRSYSGELKSPKTGLLHAALLSGTPGPDDRADRHFLRSRARGSHSRATARQAEPAPVRARARRDGPLRRRAIGRARSSRSAGRFRSTAGIRSRGAMCWSSGRLTTAVDRQARESAADRRSSRPPCGRRSRGAISKRARRRSSRRCAPSARTSVSPAARQAVEEAAEPLEARGIIVYDRGRFRVRDRNVLRYYARAHRPPAHDGFRPHALMLDVASKAFFQTLSYSRTLKTLASRYGMSRAGTRSRAGSSPARPSTMPSPPSAHIQAQGLLSTLDYLGESVTSLAAAETATREYLHLIEAVDRAGVERNLSLKLTQLGLDVDRAICVDNLRRILSGGRAMRILRADRHGELAAYGRDARHLRDRLEARAAQCRRRAAIVPLSHRAGFRAGERTGRAHQARQRGVPRAQERRVSAEIRCRCRVSAARKRGC